MLSSMTKLQPGVEVAFVAQLILLVGRGDGGCRGGRRHECSWLGVD
jgi:hypothetical protein